MGNAQSADVAVLVVYLAATLSLGLWARRLLGAARENEESYYLAGRRVPAWVNGISYAATAINADVAPLYCGLAVVIGLPVAWFYVSRFALAWMIVAALFAVRWRQLGVSTGPEFYALRFGGRGARFVRVYTALFAVAVNMTPWIGAGLLGAHKILGPVLGVESKWATLACVAPLVAGYVWVSGFAGVLMTDVMQSAVIVTASAVLLGAVLVQAGGPQQLGAALATAHPAEHAEIVSIIPAPGHEVLSPLLVLAWLVVPTIGRGGNVDVDGQRLFSCRSPRESAKMTIWALAAMFAMLLLITLPVLGMLAAEPHLYHATASEREQVYGQMLARYLPAGALGLVLAGILASVMSTISSHLNYGAQTVVNDVLRPLLPGARYLDPQRRECLWVGRVATLAILLCGVGVMFAADSLFRIAAVIAGMFASSAAFFWAQWWWWRVNFPAWVAAMLGGPVVYFTLGTLLPRGAWWQEQLARSEAAADSLAMLQAVIAMGLTTLLWVAVAWLTPPESNETLTRFYRHARPMGSWGPVRRLVADHVPADLPAEPSGLLAGGLAVAVIGAVTAALAALGLSQACVGQWVAAGCLLAGALAAATVFRASFGWHMNRLEAE